MEKTQSTFHLHYICLEQNHLEKKTFSLSFVASVLGFSFFNVKTQQTALI